MNKKIHVIGITGGIATGKSTVAAYLKKEGFRVFLADQVAHDALHPSTSIYKHIIKVFGSSILSNTGEIDRHQLGERVFADKREMKKLEHLVHPYVRHMLLKMKSNHPQLFFADIPLLYEAHFDKHVDLTLVVSCHRTLQIKRLMTRNHLKRSEAIQRIESQMSLKEKIERADVVITNNKKISDLESKMKSWLDQLELTKPSHFGKKS